MPSIFLSREIIPLTLKDIKGVEILNRKLSAIRIGVVTSEITHNIPIH